MIANTCEADTIKSFPGNVIRTRVVWRESRRKNLPPELNALVETWEEKAVFDFGVILIFDTIKVFSSKKSKESPSRLERTLKRIREMTEILFCKVDDLVTKNWLFYKNIQESKHYVLIKISRSHHKLTSLKLGVITSNSCYVIAFLLLSIYLLPVKSSEKTVFHVIDSKQDWQ